MASTYDDDEDDVALPDSIKQLIDAAFDDVLDLNGRDDHPPFKRRRITESQPGGFLPPSPSPQPLQSHIPFSLIPAALARLNLAPDDEDVLQVFRNAASGWSRSQSHPSGLEEGEAEGVVSRKDFRAVCAVLLDAESAPSPPSRSSISGAPIAEGGGFLIEDENEGGGFIPPTTSTSAAVSDHFDSGDDGSDVYQDSDSSNNSSADEYVEGPFPSRPSKSKRRTKPPSDYDSDEDMADPPHPHAKKPLSPKQKKESRLAFGLFFPDVGDDKLDEQRIMIRDIIRVAGLLKEKIKAEEVRVLFYS
jgi:hypothetical protein